MSMDCITFRSITPAQRGQRVLQQGGVKSSLQRTPRQMERLGCGYCLRVPSGQLERAAALLTQANLSFHIPSRDGGGGTGQ